jgi:hypothetical protein
VRLFVLTAAASLLARSALAQASVVADLWRVAEGTMVVPAALADDGVAAFWTPAVILAGPERYRVGISAVHAPSEIGVSGGIAAFSVRLSTFGTMNVSYGRLGIGSVGYTETSPEIVGGAIDIYNQAFSVGVAGRLADGLTGGLAVRYLSGKMGWIQDDQLGVDVGAKFEPNGHLLFGATTHFLEPAFADPSDAASYSFGAEARSSAFKAWGTTGRLAFRVGLQTARANEDALLITGGLTLGPSFALDYGAEYQSTNVESVWRSRLGVGITAKQFTARIARDGGVHGFGATYSFGMTATFR